MGLNKEIKFDKNLIIIIILFIVVFVLGFLGWMEFYENIDREVSNLRITVLTAGLFYKNIFWPIVAEYMGIAEYNIPVLLNFARLTAPLLLLYTVFFVVISIFKKTALIYFYRWFKKEYTIIVGYNERVHSFINNSIKTAKDSKQKKEQKQRFVLFTEKDNIPLLEEKNLIIFDNEKEIMKKVVKLKPFKAEKIILWHEDDLKNKENLMTILENKKAIDRIKEDDSKDIFIHLENPLLNEKMKKADPHSKVSVHTFNVDNIIASTVVDEYAPDKYLDLSDSKKQLKIIIFGFDNLGYNLLIEILQMYIFPNLNTLQIILIDNSIEKKKQMFFNRYGTISQYADISTMEYFEFFQNSGFEKISDLDMCFTCFKDAMENDFIAKKVRQLYFKMNANLQIPKIIQIAEKTENDILYKIIEKEDQELKIEFFDSVEKINYETIILENEKNEPIAEQIHEFYRKQPKSKIKKSWNQLNAYFKEENFYVVRHLDYKMRFINHQIVPKNAPGISLDLSQLDESTRSMLAKVEHERWMMRKLLAGYIHGEETDKKIRDKIKIHKDIVSWNNLSEDDKTKDDTTIRNLKEILEPADMKVIKLKR